jgi:glutamine amidotransferase
VIRAAVVDYGAGNTRSVCSALARLGVTAPVTSDPAALRSADVVVLPGVGSARSAMVHLRETGADEALRRRFAGDEFTLGICLGMQLAVERTDEDGGVDGLGLLEGRVRRVDAPRVPRIGWATVEPWGETYYFAHTYALDAPDAVATSEGICAAVRRGAFLGVQFHPEKSGPAGMEFLERCLSLA